MSEMERQAASEEQEKEAGLKTGKKKNKKEKEKKPLWKEILSWVYTLLGAVAIALVIRSVIVEPVKVEGDSMLNTLYNGDIMLVSKYDYSSTWLCFPWQSDNKAQQAPRITIGNPNFLDIVICHYPARGATNFVKRIVGMPGDTVELREGYLFVNGEQVEEEKDLIEPAFRTGGGSSFGPYRVPKRGDSLTVSGSREKLAFTLNGEDWKRGKTCVIARDEEGKQLKIWNKKVNDKSRNGRQEAEMVMLSWEGKEYTQDDWSGIIPDLSGKTFTVDEDYYFVMGDHRNDSNDSRAVGALERSMIIGHVRRVVLPFSHWGGVK